MYQINREEGRIEKWVLRRAFDDEEHPYLPKVNNPKSKHFLIQTLALLNVLRLTCPV